MRALVGHRRFRRIVFGGVALIFAAIGAHSLNPRQLYSEMYPVEPVKRDAFHICDEADPTFVRAVGAEREACYNKMPHVMAVAMGRVRPGGALSMQALTDPSREAELLMMLAAMPPRQPVTAPRSFSNTAWAHALSPSCDDKVAGPAVASVNPVGLPPPPGSGRAAALNDVIRGNLPPLPRSAQPAIARFEPLPAIPLVPGKAGAAKVATSNGGAGAIATFNPLPAPDVGDDPSPAIVPLAPGKSCGGA